MTRFILLLSTLLVAACARDEPTASEPIDEPPVSPPIGGGGAPGGAGAPPLSCPSGVRCYTVTVAARDAYTSAPVLGAQVSVVSQPGASTFISQQFPVDEHGNFSTGEAIPEGTPVEVTVSAPAYATSVPSKAFWNVSMSVQLVSDTVAVAGIRGLVTAGIRSPSTGQCTPSAFLDGTVKLYAGHADLDADPPLRAQRLAPDGSFVLYDLPPADYQIALFADDGFRVANARRAERGRTAFAPFSVPCR